MEETAIPLENPNDKVNVKFASNIKKLLALVAGDKNLKHVKVNNSEVNQLVQEMLFERKTEVWKKFKEDASKLIDLKIQFDRETKKAEEDFKNTITQKKKEFNDKMETTFKLVEDMDKLEKDYSLILTTE